MSAELTIFSSLVALLALLAALRPSLLFAYPVSVALLMWFFIVPQAWKIEAIGEMGDYEPTTTWFYMTLCTVLMAVGFLVGSARAAGPNSNGLAQLTQRYDLNKLFVGALLLTVIGGIAVILMAREQATMSAGDVWTGPIAFYAMLSSLMIYGASLGWLLYLYTGDKKALGIALIGLAVDLPPILFAARRELTFTVASIVLLGFFFVKKKSMSRLILFPLIFLGGILVNQAGEIRGYIKSNDSSVIGALASDEVSDRSSKVKNNYNETASAVSDISLSNWSDHYSFFAPYYNTLVQLYVPAFLVGHDNKEAVKITVEEDDDTDVRERFYASGATRTGFSDSFQSLHFFGCLIFFLIAFVMGILWTRAKSGDIMSQLYYMVLLSAGLKAITESTSAFFGVLPLIIGSTWAVFQYAKRPARTLSVGRAVLPSRHSNGPS